jgi:hypothetical protein
MPTNVVVMGEGQVAFTKRLGSLSAAFCRSGFHILCIAAIEEEILLVVFLGEQMTSLLLH